jgi:hypothetical protein
VGGWIMSSEVKENKYLIGEYNNEVFIKFI